MFHLNLILPSHVDSVISQDVGLSLFIFYLYTNTV